MNPSSSPTEPAPADAMQRQLVAAARRAAIANLARSLTHEINNALTPIIAYAQMIELAHRAEPETVERSQQIVAHARRIADWLTLLRQLADNTPRAPIPFSLNGIVRAALEWYAEYFARLDIHVETDLDPALPPLEGFPDQLQEVFISLIQNATEAMRGGGRLHIASHHVDGEVVLQFTDSGSGIAAADLPHVTEPGFSTKQTANQDSGLGWGLFAAKQLVEAQQGSLEIASPPAQGVQGTRVEIHLPLPALRKDNISSDDAT